MNVGRVTAGVLAAFLWGQLHEIGGWRGVATLHVEPNMWLPPIPDKKRRGTLFSRWQKRIIMGDKKRYATTLAMKPTTTVTTAHNGEEANDHSDHNTQCR